MLRIVALVALARLLSPEVFGLVAIVQAIALFASNLAQMGLSMAASQAETLSQNSQSVLSHLQTGMGALLALLMVALAQPVAHWYGHEELAAIMMMLALVPLLQGAQSQYRVRLVREMRFGVPAFSEVIALVIAVGVAIVLAAMGYTYIALVAQLVLQPALQFVILAMAARWLPSLRVHWDDEVRGVLRVGGHVLVMNLMRNIARSALTPIIGLSLAPAAIGQYDRAQQLTVAPIYLTTDALARVAVPVLATLRRDPTRQERYLVRAQLLTTYGSATVFMVIGAMCPQIVVLLLGEQWTLTGMIFGVFCVGAVFRILCEVMSWVFVTSDSSRAGAVLSLVAQPLVVAASLIGLPWGVLGVAIANSVAWFVYWPICTYVAARASGLSLAALFQGGGGTLARFPLPVGIGTFVGVRLGDTWGPYGSLACGAAGAVVAGLLMATLPVVRRDLRAVVATARLVIQRRASGESLASQA